MFAASTEWKKMYPGAHVGVLVMSHVANPKSHPALDQRKKDLEKELRSRFTNTSQLKDHPILQAYKDYYKRFKKTYHVAHQVESVVFKGKSLPKVAALVEAMFVAELDGMLLTAGHDLDAVKTPAGVDVAKGGEKFVKLNGEEQELKAADMFVADRDGIISSVIYGPDQRTRITPETTRVMFTTYAVPGVPEDTLRTHLQGIESCVRLITPEARVELMEIYGAD